MPDALTLDQARRVALAAQGLAAPARSRPAGPATLRATLERLGAIQIDSINVVARSHELVLAARAGVHDRAAFDRVVYRRRAGFEYWGHAASFLPMASFRLCLPRMRRLAASTRGWWADIRRRHQHLYGPVLDRIRAEGPLAASAFRDPDGPPRGAGGTGRRPSTCSRTCSTRGWCWSTTGSTSSAATTWPSGSCRPGPTPPSRPRPRPPAS